MKKIIKKIIFKLLEFELLFHKKNRSGKKRLLLIRIDAIGDFIIFSPMIKYYKKLFPNHSITLMINKLNEGLVKQYDNYVDEIIIFDREKYRKNPFLIRELFIKVKKGNFDIAIYPAFSREMIGDLLVKISNAGKKIGFNGELSNISKKELEKNNKYYTKLIEPTPGILIETERNREFIEALGLKPENHTPLFIPNDNDENQARIILNKNDIAENDKFIVIAPGSGPGKRWPIEKFIKTINWLAQNKKIKIVICGGKNEEHLARQIENNVNCSVANIAGQTSLPVLASILKKSCLYFGNDTGAVHLAAAVNTPTICIMGGRHFGRFFPYGDLNKNRIVFHKMPCFNCNWTCKYDRIKCVEHISTEQVIDEINKII